MEPIYEFGGFRLETRSGLLWFGSSEHRLPPKIYNCLLVLLENPGRVVTKDDLAQRLWPDTFVDDNALTYTVSQLRKSIRELDPQGNFVETVPKLGYRFSSPVLVSYQTDEHETANGTPDRRQTVIERVSIEESWSEDISASDDALDTVHQEAIAKTGSSRAIRLSAKPALAVLLGVFVTFGFVFYVRQAPSPTVGRIAVLPFRSFAASTEDSELRLRIADAVITRLGNLSHLIVRPTNSIVKFAESNADAIEIGRELSVDAVLDGRLQNENGKLRATVQLISVNTGEQIWSAKFDGTADRLIALQDQIAEGLLARLIELRPQERDTHLTAVTTTNAEAYGHYLQGRYFFDQRGVDFDASLKKAKSYFEKALEIDPQFTSATAELANVINLQTSSGTYKRDVGYPRARELALKALQEDNNSPDAYVALGWVYQKLDYNFDEAERSFKRAIELNQNHVLAHLWLNINYSLQGKLDEAGHHIDRALSIDPSNSTAHIEKTQLFIRKGRCDEAMAYAPRVLEHINDPARRSLTKGELDAMCKRFDLAIPLLESGAAEIEARGLKPARVYVILGYAYAASGNREKALEVAARLEQMKATRNVHSGLVAIYANLGDTEKFHKALDELYGSGDERLLQLKVDPRYDVVRDDPRFQAVLRKVNLL
jgi:serine/threonine-protein kinase